MPARWSLQDLTSEVRRIAVEAQDWESFDRPMYNRILRNLT